MLKYIQNQVDDLDDVDTQNILIWNLTRLAEVMNIVASKRCSWNETIKNR